MAGLEKAAKNKVMQKSRAELGSLYFNWRAQARGSRIPISKEKCLAPLHGTFGLNMAKVDMLSGQMLSEAYTSFVIMLVSLKIL